MFLDPLVHGVWPPELLALLEQHQVTWETSEEDLAVIREHTVDELGLIFTTRTGSKPRRGPGIRTPVPSGPVL